MPSGGDILFYSIAAFAVLLNAGCMVLTIFQLPGPWLMLAVTLAFGIYESWMADWASETLILWGVAMGLLVIFAAIGEVIETVASARGASKSGGTRTAAVMSIVGGVVGAILGTIFIPILIVGTIAGACIGAGLFAISGDLMQGRTFAEARGTGKGAVVGKLFGTVGKVVTTGMMWVVATVAVCWPGP